MDHTILHFLLNKFHIIILVVENLSDSEINFLDYLLKFSNIEKVIVVHNRKAINFTPVLDCEV